MPDMLAHRKKENLWQDQRKKELARSHLIAFRLTDVEYDLVTKMAQEADLSASAYIRKLLLEGNVNITYEVVADVPELQKLTAEFGKIGSNLNQIARYFHMGGIRSKAMQHLSLFQNNAIMQILSDIYPNTTSLIIEKSRQKLYCNLQHLVGFL